MENMAGFIRAFDCGRIKPWFYGEREEEIYGCFALPKGTLPVYQYPMIGQQPLFTRERRIIEGNERRVKRCIGVLPKDKKGSKAQALTIFWGDGTVSLTDSDSPYILERFRPFDDFI
jgi:hypothetical protein